MTLQLSMTWWWAVKKDLCRKELRGLPARMVHGIESLNKPNAVVSGSSMAGFVGSLIH